MDPLTEVDDLLRRLLHHRRARVALRAGTLPLTAAQREAVETLDPVELERVAESVRDELLRRTHRGSGSLITLFPRTIAHWRAAHPEDVELAELASRFLESAAYETHRALSFGVPGTSLEEAFFRFAEAGKIGAPAAREAEFLDAMMRALAISPRPSFSTPPEARRVSGGFAAVSRDGSPMLHAVSRGRFLRGPVSALIADLIDGRTAPTAAAARHGVSEAVLRATLAELEALGLASTGPLCP